MSERRFSGPRGARQLLVGGGLLAWSLGVSPALADGAYGRLGGDLGLQGSAGAVFGRGAAVGVSASALYLVSVGPYASAEVALNDRARGFGPRHGEGAPDRADDEPRLRSVSTGVEVRPLFLPRFLKAAETGRGFWDLLLDSVGLRLGARFHPGTRARGLEVGGVLDVPLGSTYPGAFLGLAVTKELTPAALAGLPSRGEDTLFFAVSLGFRGLLTTHLVDFGDEARRR